MPEWITSFSEATFPAWWGAVLSTTLLIVKFWEIWQSRFKIEIGGYTSDSPEHGNEVRIRNLSPKPMVVTHWSIFYSSGNWPFRKEKNIQTMEFDASDIVIGPISSHTLSFTEDSYFPTNFKSLKGRSIYISINVAGKRNIRKKVYPY